MELIDGKKVAAEIKQELAAEVNRMIADGKRRPHLAAILVGHDGGSETYVANKVKACEDSFITLCRNTCCLMRSMLSSKAHISSSSPSTRTTLSRAIMRSFGYRERTICRWQLFMP